MMKLRKNKCVPVSVGFPIVVGRRQCVSPSIAILVKYSDEFSWDKCCPIFCGISVSIYHCKWFVGWLNGCKV
jgi:hypothetical protein